MQTQQAVHHVKSPSNAHQYEAVALESELGNPANMKSKTSMGFASGSRHKQRADEAILIDPAPRDPRQLSKSRVDQKRQIDSKLSIVRRNAEKLRQKRQQATYKQSSAATRTKS